MTLLIFNLFVSLLFVLISSVCLAVALEFGLFGKRKINGLSQHIAHAFFALSYCCLLVAVTGGMRFGHSDYWNSENIAQYRVLIVRTLALIPLLITSFRLWRYIIKMKSDTSGNGLTGKFQ